MAVIDSADLAARIAAHVQRLAVEIGTRPGGSPANRAAAGYIRSIFEACGMDVEMQEIPFPAWEEAQTRLDIDGAHIAAVANAFSPCCDVTAPAVAVGTLAQLETAEISGRIAILYGELAADPIAPKSWFLKSDKDERIIQLLEQKAPAAVIAVQPRQGELERIIQDWEFLIPSITVPARSGLALLRADSPTIHLRIETRQTPGQTWNVIGRKPGAGRNRIVLCAHYDTNWGTPGALDNGGGVAVVLALAESLGKTVQNLGLECVAFTNEDSGMPVGSLEYVQREPARLDEIVALMNFDGVGHALDVASVCMMSNSAPFHALVSDVKNGHPAIIWVDPWPESDHSAFAMQGVASLAFTSRAESYLNHLRSDTIEWVSVPQLSDVALFATQIADRLQEHDPAWTRAAAQ